MKPSRNELYRLQQEKLSVLRQTRAAREPYRIADSVVTIQNEPIPHEVLLEMISEQQAVMATAQAPVRVSTQEANELLGQLRARWDAERVHQLIGDCRSTALKSIAGPFGLGYIVAAADKVGGNVDTIHNARNKDESGKAKPIFATDEARIQYEQRGQYDKKTASAYHKAKPYIDAGRANDDALKQGQLTDDYTGEKFSQSDRHNQQSRPTVDHVVSCKEIHDDPGRILAELDGVELANRKANLKTTSKSVNSAMGADKKTNAMQRLEGEQIKRRVDIAALEAKHELNDQERKQLTKLRKAESVNRERVMAADKEARREIDKEVNLTYYTSKKFATGVLKTGAGEAGKRGLQQSIGLLLVEFLTASFDEIIDVYKHGICADMQSEKFSEALRQRLGRIAKRVAAKWKDALVAFKDGAISGFLTNLATVLINTVVTTGMRVVRVIREGLMSILSALKMALFPPEGMTRAQACDAALKLLATGLMTSLGVMAEEACEKAITAFFSANLPMLVPIAAPVAAVMVATMTGLATALLVYSLDRLDIFGVRAQREHGMILTELGQALQDGDHRIDLYLAAATGGSASSS